MLVPGKWEKAIWPSGPQTGNALSPSLVMRVGFSPPKPVV
jgi:hypothetical protein